VDEVVAELRRVAVESPEVIRVAVGLVGAVVLFAGARLYHKALFLACFGAGAVGALLLLDVLSRWSADLERPVVLIAGAVVGGVAVAGLVAVVERFALFAAGALAGLAGMGALGSFVPLPGWALAIGVIGGAIALPLLFPLILKAATAVIGAVLVAWAVGYPAHAWVLVGLAVVGAAVQFGFVGGKPEEPEDEGEE
jgi:hypothetical protein